MTRSGPKRAWPMRAAPLLPALMALLAGCATGPTRSDAESLPPLPVAADAVFAAGMPAAETGPASLAAGSAAAAPAPRPGGADGPAPPHWWQGFEDPGLAEWVQLALADRPALAAARERLAAARAQLDGAAAARGFTLTAEAGATADLRDSASRRVSPSAGLALAWDADLGGGLAAAQRAALARQLQAEELLEAERAATAALTAAAYVEWRLGLADATLLDEAQALLREAERVARVRFDAGLSPRLDLERAAAERAANDAQRAAAAARVQRAAAALQVLAGRAPQALAAGLVGAEPPAGAPAFPDSPSASAALSPTTAPTTSPARRLPRAAALAASTPAQMLAQRPDLRAAARAVQAAGAEIGVAADALAPRLRLPGNLVLGLASGRSAVEVVTASLAALLEWPLVDGGAARAGLAAAQARWREAGALYRDATLAALAEAEGALADAAAAESRQAALERAEAASEAALAHARTLYGAGLVGFLDVVDAQRSLVDARRARLAAQADGVLAAVAWYRALGRAS